MTFWAVDIPDWGKYKSVEKHVTITPKHRKMPKNQNTGSTWKFGSPSHPPLWKTVEY